MNNYGTPGTVVCLEYTAVKIKMKQNPNQPFLFIMIRPC